eukprot:gene56932-biopygen57342
MFCTWAEPQLGARHAFPAQTSAWGPGCTTGWRPGGGNVFPQKLWAIDEKKSQFKWKTVWRIAWFDCALSWDPSSTQNFTGHRRNVGAPTDLLYPSVYQTQWRGSGAQPFYVARVWTEESVKEDMQLQKGFVVSPLLGMAVRFAESVETVACKMDFTDLPFDTQRCKVNILLGQDVFTSRLMAMGHQELGPIRVDGSSGAYPLPPSLSRPERGGAYDVDVLTIEFEMHRRPAYFLTAVVQPGIIMLRCRASCPRSVTTPEAWCSHIVLSSTDSPLQSPAALPRQSPPLDGMCSMPQHHLTWLSAYLLGLLVLGTAWFCKTYNSCSPKYRGAAPAPLLLQGGRPNTAWNLQHGIYSMESKGVEPLPAGPSISISISQRGGAGTPPSGRTVGRRGQLWRGALGKWRR